MTIYKIWSKAYSRVPANVLIGTRTEYIDTSKNKLFMNCKNASQVKQTYLNFWNISMHEEIVKVIKVKKIKNMKSQGSNWGIKTKTMKH